MSLSNFSPDRVLIEQIATLEDVDEEGQLRIMALGISLLEGKDVVDDLQAFGEQAAKLAKACPAVASLLWDCSKFASKNQQLNALQDALLLAGMNESITNCFIKTFQDNRRRLLALKGSLGVCAFSYQNLSWRLEVELGKRSMHAMSEPKYLLRLDLVNNSVSANEVAAEENTAVMEKFRSHHLQADHANMKLLEQELQRAVDEVNSVHSQRINRYLS